MKRYAYYLLPALLVGLPFTACQEDADLVTGEEPISQEVIQKIAQMGFNPDGIERVEEGYRIERDIIITHEMLASTPTDHIVPNVEQYRTTNLVNATGGRLIRLYAPTGGKNGYDAAMIAGIDEAIRRYNAEGLSLTFTRVTSSGSADIVFSRLSRRDEQRGVLGSAGFPTSSGDPYGQIQMSGVLQSTYGLNTNEIASIIAHEMGHCIGFRHTDYFNRSISCGGAADNEGSSGVGAIHIPNTPTGATLSAQSWMLSCTDGSNRPFNNDDRTALNYLY